MTAIYIKHANGDIMEVQNWATLTDYGAMVTRPLAPDERQRYLALKAIHLKDSEIWRLFHPYTTKENDRSTPTSPCSSTNHGKFQRSQAARPERHSRIRNQHHGTHTSSSDDPPIDVQIHNIPKKTKREDSTPLIEISIRDLSKRALLHIIQKACSRDIRALRTASRDELLSLASVILPQKGVRVTVMSSSSR